MHTLAMTVHASYFFTVKLLQKAHHMDKNLTITVLQLFSHTHTPYMYMYSYTHIHTPTHIYSVMHTHTHTHTHTCTHTITHTSMHAHIHTNIHIIITQTQTYQSVLASHPECSIVSLCLLSLGTTSTWQLKYNEKVRIAYMYTVEYLQVTGMYMYRFQLYYIIMAKNTVGADF